MFPRIKTGSVVKSSDISGSRFFSTLNVKEHRKESLIREREQRTAKFILT